MLEGESRPQYDALWRGLCNHFRPAGAYEEGLVEMLAVTQWRQRRLLIAEGAEIQAGKEFIESDWEQRKLIDIYNIMQANRNEGIMSRMADFGALQICLNLLSELETGIEARVCRRARHPGLV